MPLCLAQARSLLAPVCVGLLACWSLLNADELDHAQGRERFNVRCAGCHGAEGLGGERAPALGQNARSRFQTDAAVRELIRKGLSDSGMPGFAVSEEELAQLTSFVLSRTAPLRQAAVSGDAQAGAAFFFGAGGCAECHLLKGRGGLKGPDLTEIGGRLTRIELEVALRTPNRRRVPGYAVASAHLVSGETVRGFVKNESGFDLQVQGFDGRLILLDRRMVKRIERSPASLMPPLHATPEQERDLIAFLARVPEWSPGESLPQPPTVPGTVQWPQIMQPPVGDWPSYHGQLSGNRYSTLGQITPSNVRSLAPRWNYPLENGRALQTTPVVVDGVMYVTAVNTVVALDGSTGRKIWDYVRPRSKGLVGDAAGGINRGVAILGDRVFLATDNAHLIALHRTTGALLWETEMADAAQHYGATGAPLVVGDLVVSGVSGGDEGVRGFLAAYKVSTGERVWRFWTIPARGDPEAATWKGRALEHGCGATWLTGTYDAGTNTLFWTTGNPCPDFNGDERQGDNLYTDSVLALQPQTGKLKWYYQFTPHDLHDWDATETPLLADAVWEGKPRKLLLQGNRNGFFYVLDRTTGEFLRATPFVKKLTWAKEIGKDGRPVLGAAWQPTREGTAICPSMDGASNWMSTAYDPPRGLFFLMALEKCNVFSKSPEWWKQGQSFYGGAAKPVEETPHKFLRALDLATGKIAWEYAQTGAAETWGGVLALASGLVFCGDDNGAFTALDATTGRPLWHAQLNARWHASPMTYLAGGRQYLAIAAGPGIQTFALTQ